MKNIFILILWLLFIPASSADDHLNKDDIVGYWFGCEFGSTFNRDIDLDSTCSILDDDGYQFTESGNIYKVELSSQRSEPECGRSPCFRSNRSAITVRSKRVGDYSLEDGSLTINIGYCSDTNSWQVSSELAKFESYCVKFENSYASKYTGKVRSDW